ncbi:hypothetical protein ENUP19_0311G0008 [Entamoeba nuttalli]|uniref:Rab family GTPase n=2 Tax=Entamoeba nuttalli TaxID=412467 RepID=K2GTQ0_ENTNP|nr:Rab family GTPase [Entamoeba nuttalli P19]EKE38433.1 Rab family GTPase [Entamoeba nuttalli P19]|eukprot:XP_008859231.1 Rab family GTPase [Entamoeba nuttalli P19]
MSTLNYKIVLVGDVATGKTALIQRLITNGFTEGHAQTIVASCQSKTIVLKDNKSVNINVWDTAGQERFRSLISNFYRGSSGIIVCYDVSENSSLDVVPTWVEAAQNSVDDNVCWLLVGCKSDLVNSVDEEKLKEIIEKYHFTHLTCSSKTGDNVNEVFTTLCQLIVDKLNSNNEITTPNKQETEQQDDEIIKIVAQPQQKEANGEKKEGDCKC